MLLTVTPNPAIDRTIHVPQLTVGAVHRATKVIQGAGGKGLNVSRAARTLGYRVLTTGLLAGGTGQIVADLAQTEGLAADWYWLKAGETRVCSLLNEDSGKDTVINEPGPTVSAEGWGSFAQHIRGLATQAGAVALTGSLPPGIAPEVMGALARSLVAPERAIYLDTSGPALAEALARPGGLCIKVNRAELAAGLNLAGQSPKQLIEAAQTLLANGAALVVVTLGPEGALAITPEGCWQATPCPVEVVSTVGSGDSLLAGLAVARLEGRPLEAALSLGVACGAANALTKLPGRFERKRAEELLKQIDVSRLN